MPLTTNSKKYNSSIQEEAKIITIMMKSKKTSFIAILHRLTLTLNTISYHYLTSINYGFHHVGKIVKDVHSFFMVRPFVFSLLTNRSFTFAARELKASRLGAKRTNFNYFTLAKHIISLSQSCLCVRS